jgi:pilus assembly protein CpaE
MPVIAAKATEVARPLRMVSVFSPRGGTGVSTIAVNLALSLLEETGQRVLLVEGKLFFGHLDLMLNLRSQNNIADLVPHAAALDEGLVRDVVTDHVSGLSVLLAPSNMQIAQGIRPDDLYNIVVAVQRHFDLVVVDAGNFLNENSVTFLDASDRLLLVTTPDLASLHDTNRFIQQVSRSLLAYPAEKLLVVLNRAGIPGGVRTSDVEPALHHPIFAQVPDDAEKPLLSLNRGIPLTIRYPRSPASRAIRDLAKALSQIKTVALADEETEVERSQKEALLASSQYG